MSNVTLRDPLCERAREYVSLRLDCELSELEDALLDAHLSRCAACRSFAIATGAMTGELRGARQERPSAPIAVPRRRYASVRALRVGAAAAVLAVAVLAAELQNVLRDRTTIVARASVLAEPGADVHDLRSLNRASLESGLRISPSLLRSLRLPGDG
jgi:putative zinc finger protein